MANRLTTALMIVLATTYPATAGANDLKKPGNGDVYENLPGVKTPPPVTTLGSKPKDCETVQSFDFDRFSGRRVPTLTYRCSQGNVDFYSTLPPVP
jgi:hypothetical protein